MSVRVCPHNSAVVLLKVISLIKKKENCGGFNALKSIVSLTRQLSQFLK